MSLEATTIFLSLSVIKLVKLFTSKIISLLFSFLTRLEDHFVRFIEKLNDEAWQIFSARHRVKKLLCLLNPNRLLQNVLFQRLFVFHYWLPRPEGDVIEIPALKIAKWYTLMIFEMKTNHFCFLIWSQKLQMHWRSCGS